MYTNADQLLNKIEDLKVVISGSDIDVIMITEVIPKAQKNAIPKCVLNIEGYNLFLNFDCTQENLGESGIRGVAIYIKNTIVKVKKSSYVMSIKTTFGLKSN